MSALIEFLTSHGQSLFGSFWPVLWSIIRILCIVAPIMITVAYLTYAERKVISYIQVRIGPNRVGPIGLLQPLADGIKLMSKEILIPSSANKLLFVLGPIMVIMPALAAWAAVPFGPELVLADLNAGLLFIMAITSLEVYGVIIAGWASNSKYAFLGAMRASAQMVSYEIAMGLCLLIVLLVSGSLNIGEIVSMQNKGWGVTHGWNLLSWNWLPLLPVFVIYVISGVAETNRHPFDVVEGESEIVAGHMVEYSGMSFAIFFLAEYANMILISALTALFFLGGWAAPASFLGFIPGFVWFVLKISFVLFLFLWIRATFPRYRYDQIMRLGWKVFIPITLVWLVLVAGFMQTPWNIWH